MEFEERRKASERVRFWVLVEGLKDPLEDQLNEVALGSTASVPLLSDNAIDDLRLIWSSCLSRDPFRSSPSHLGTIREFVERAGSEPASVQELRKVRFAIFAIQHEVFETMQDDEFPAFVASDLYYKAIANLEPRPVPPDVPPPDLKISIDSVAAPRNAAVAEPTRRRSLSNPTRPSRQDSITLEREGRQARTPSPVPPMQLAPGKTFGAHRTETLPPQVTFKDPFDSPRLRKTASSSDTSRDLQTSRKTSSGSLDTQHSTSSGAMSKKGPVGAALSDSLEFLMASPTPETQERSPLFDELVLSESDEPVDYSPSSEEDYIRVETIEAIQDALSSILETNAKTPTLTQRPFSGSPELERHPTTNKPSRTRNLPPPRHPSLSLFPSSSSTSPRSSPVPPTPPAPSPPVLPPPTRTVSSGSAPLSTRRQKVVFEDAESLEDVETDPRCAVEFDPQSIQLAAPGDLHLPGEIKRLAASLDKLRSQESVVEALIRKAELTGNGSELKLLVKSQDSLRREIRAASFQKDQYENQELENKLTPNGTRVSIPGTTVGQAEGQSFQLYLVEVHQVNGDDSFRSGWIVTRRYSEFASLYSKLRDKFVPARYLDFPSKRIVTSYSKEFIEQRRVGLERYLQVSFKKRGCRLGNTDRRRSLTRVFSLLILLPGSDQDPGHLPQS